MRRALAAVAPLLLAAAAPAAGQVSSDRILVMPFAVSADPAAPRGAGATVWLGEAAAVLLTGALDGGTGRVLTRDERVAAFDRLQWPMSPTLPLATLIRVGELVGASAMVVGELRLADTLVVRARLVRLDQGRSLPAVDDEAPLTSIFALFERVGHRLEVALGKPAGEVATVPYASLDAFENYVKGLVAATPAARARFLETARKQAPRDGRILTALWAAYSDQNAHEKALAAASDVPAGSAWSRRARFDAALSLIELKRYDGAYKALLALEAERGAAVLENALGVIQLRRADAGGDAAVSFFRRAVAREPDRAEYLFNLGYALAVQRETAAALTALRDVVRRDAADGGAHLVMSAVLSSSGKPVEAGREFELAKLLGTRLDAGQTAATDRVPAGLERLAADLDVPSTSRVAPVLAGSAQREQEQTAEFHLEQGRRLYAAHDDRGAISELRRAIYLSPYADEPHVLLGRLYLRAGRTQEAIDEFKVAIWCRESAGARVALGEALLQAGDRDAARQEANRALVLAPDSPEAKDLIRRIGGAPLVPTFFFC